MSGKTPEMKACPQAQLVLNLVRECLGLKPLDFDSRHYLAKIAREAEKVSMSSECASDWCDYDDQELPFSERET